MNTEKNTVWVLSLTAIVLLLALLFVPDRGAGQSVSLKDGDYLVATHKAATGGDALYIADTRMGLVGMFAYDPAARRLVLRAVCPLAQAFVAR